MRFIAFAPAQAGLLLYSSKEHNSFPPSPKHALLALAPKGIPSTSINRPKLFCLRRHTPPPLASLFPTHSVTPAPQPTLRRPLSSPASHFRLISAPISPFFSHPPYIFPPQKKRISTRRRAQKTLHYLHFSLEKAAPPVYLRRIKRKRSGKRWKICL